MITKIKWNNHEILGNLELDFTKADGSPYSTIILAGENGTGKTTILETLSTFLNLGSIEPFEFIEYNIENNLYTIIPLSEDNKQLGFHKRICKIDGQPKILDPIVIIILIPLSMIFLISDIMDVLIQRHAQDLQQTK